MAYFTTQNLVTSSLTMMNNVISSMMTSNTVAWFEKIAERNTISEQHILLKSAAIDGYLATDISQIYYVLFRMKKASDDTNLTGVEFNEVTMTIGTSQQISWTGTTAADTEFTVSSNAQTFTVFNPANSPLPASAGTYILSLTTRGFVFSYWKNLNHNAKNANFIVDIQRPVNPTTGIPNTGGQAPIFFIGRSITNTTNAFTWGLVRDKLRPATVVYGSSATPSRNLMNKISLDWPWPVTFDTNRHVVKFASGMATPSGLYMDEMDLICFVNSMSFFHPSDIKITMYGEAADRTYTAAFGELAFGLVTGDLTTSKPSTVANARIGILKEQP